MSQIQAESQRRSSVIIIHQFIEAIPPDNVGADDYNQKLSVERAQSVADYIDAQTDIPHNKIEVRGKGASESEGETTEDRAMDRRVIINVTGTLVE